MEKYHYPNPNGRFDVVVKPEASDPGGVIVVSAMCVCGDDECAWQWTSGRAESSKYGREISHPKQRR